MPYHKLFSDKGSRSRNNDHKLMIPISKTETFPHLKVKFTNKTYETVQNNQESSENNMALENKGKFID